VATGAARAGVDDTVDPDDLLPASSLKGVMRSAAGQLLPRHPTLIDEVFGSRARPGRERDPKHSSPWHWTGADFGAEPPIRARARVSIDSTTHTARRNQLVFGEEVWAETATFEITRRAPLAALVERDHHTVLACAAAAVHALGAGRRRGLGWVTLAPVDPAVDDQMLAHLESLRSADD
jgi:CRISPR/Cas system CSM-associated protein Csm3 (group 7 of RAMP superfamily)